MGQFSLLAAASAVPAEHHAPPPMLAGDSVGSITLSGQVGRVYFRNQEDGYLIFSLEGAQRPDGETAVVAGYYQGLRQGMPVETQGRWTNTARGPRFQAEIIRERVPQSVDGIASYLAAVLPKVGERTAEAIVAAFGKQTLAVLSNTPLRLHEVKGMTQEKVLLITEAWTKAKGEHEFKAFLSGLGLGPKMVERAHAALLSEGSRPYKDIIAEITKNPYQLTKVPGVGFKRADLAATSLGVKPDSPFRIEAGVVHALNDLISREGHTQVMTEQLGDVTSRLLSVDKQTVMPRIHAMMQDRLIYPLELRQKSAPPALFAAERQIAADISKLVKGAGIYGRHANLKEAIDKSDLALAQKQQQAITMALTNKISILTGGPGMGKSAITRDIVRIAKEKVERIVLLAPTGRAAQQLAKSTKQPAATIHRGIGLAPLPEDGGALELPVRKLAADLVIVDEMSMLDTHVMSHLLRAIPATASVLFVGDPDQLPSVGPGNILGDLIACGHIPVTRLTEVFRTGAGSGIAKAAFAIKHGQMPMPADDLKMVRAIAPEDVLAAMEKEVRRLLKEGMQAEDMQILSPMRVNALGTLALNDHFRRLLNPQGATAGDMVVGETTFQVGDRVIQTKNDYDHMVFNGDIGYVQHISSKSAVIAFDEGQHLVELSREELATIEPAFAMTIHKSQGGQFGAVLAPVSTAHTVMLSRNLVYTGITRAMEEVFLAGTDQAMLRAIAREDNTTRMTTLRSMLESALGAREEPRLMAMGR